MSLPAAFLVTSSARTYIDVYVCAHVFLHTRYVHVRIYAFAT